MTTEYNNLYTYFILITQNRLPLINENKVIRFYRCLSDFITKVIRLITAANLITLVKGITHKKGTLLPYSIRNSANTVYATSNLF